MKSHRLWLRRFTVYMIACFAVVIVTVSCSPGGENGSVNTNYQTNTNTVTNTNIVTNTQTNTIPVSFLSNLSVSNAYRLLIENETNPNFIVIDVRIPAEYQNGTLPGAINVDYYDNFSSNIVNYEVDNTYLIFCQSGVRSGNASRLMTNAGFLYIYNMSGGFGAYQNTRRLRIADQQPVIGECFDRKTDFLLTVRPL